MQYKFFSFSIQQAESSEEELNRFLRTHKVVEINKQLIEGQNPIWSFCVGYVYNSNVNTNEKGGNKIDYQAILSKEHYEIYEKLRLIRKEIAAEQEIPAYAVFTNKELSYLAQQEQIDDKILLQMESFGEGRMQKIGLVFLQKLNPTENVAPSV